MKPPPLSNPPPPLSEVPVPLTVKNLHREFRMVLYLATQQEYITLLQWSTSLYNNGVHQSIAMEYITLLHWSTSLYCNGVHTVCTSTMECISL